MRQQYDPHCVLEDEHDMEDMDEDEMEGMEERSEEEEEFVLDERVLFQVTVRNVCSKHVSERDWQERELFLDRARRELCILHRPASNERFISYTSAATERRRCRIPVCDITAVTDEDFNYAMIQVFAKKISVNTTGDKTSTSVDSVDICFLTPSQKVRFVTCLMQLLNDKK